MGRSTGGYVFAMWFFLRRRVRRYLLLVIALPVIGHLLVRAGSELEARRGTSDASDRLQRSGHFVIRHTERFRQSRTA